MYYLLQPWWFEFVYRSAFYRSYCAVNTYLTEFTSLTKTGCWNFNRKTIGDPWITKYVIGQNFSWLIYLLILDLVLQLSFLFSLRFYHWWSYCCCCSWWRWYCIYWMYVYLTRTSNTVQLHNMLHYSYEFNFMFSPCIFKVNHFYWPTNALNCIKLKG